MRVLVVDDDVVSRMVLMHLVDACGAFEVSEAEDGADAWEQLGVMERGGALPAICFCDLRMPNMSGMELLARVKADPALAGIAVVMVSSATEGDIVEQAVALGAAGYIVKPFQADQVRQHLDQLALTGAGAGAVDAAAEAPQATMDRLGINGERLLAYLVGFLAQVSSARTELPALLALPDQGAARARIERLQTGCITLGLTGAAARIGALSGAPLEADTVATLLNDTAAAVTAQSELVRRQCAPA
jgi:two-component system chemotaxis response regulator CheY